MIPAAPVRAALPISERWICSNCQFRGAKSTGSFLSTTYRGNNARLSSRQALGNRRREHRPNSRRSFSTTPSTRAAPTRKAKLPDSPARTRFAPSPTGYLHIGGLRTALFSYLLAKRTGGQFLLRIEDTDQKRLIPDAETRLCSDLHWAGLQWDEGPQVGGPYGPYRQSERTHIYQEHASVLLDQGSAYRCFCTPQTAGDAQAAYVTSGCYQSCSSLSSSESRPRASTGKEPFTVRLHHPPDAHKRIYRDLIYGKIQRLKRSPTPTEGSHNDTEIDTSSTADTILLKSNGTPTYHFANVIDDHLMLITHVIRGSEWMASTPVHYDIYAAFDWTPPEFAHVGLLVDKNEAKLSKRNPAGDVKLDVASMREEQGVLPETLCNFLALLGWANSRSGGDVLDMQSLVGNFDLKFTRGNAMVAMEKLWYLQKQHVALRCEQARSTRSMAPVRDIVEQITAEVRRQFPQPLLFINHDLTTSGADPLEAYCAAILLADSKSYVNAPHWVQRIRYFFAFDAEQVPVERESYTAAGTITAAVLRDAVDASAFLRSSFDLTPGFRLPWESSRDPGEEDAAVSFNNVDKLSPRIHHLLEQEICNNALSNLDAPSAWNDDHPLLQKHKSVHAALMKFLREKLCYGLPGPSVSVVMALLGYGECCRRVGVVPRPEQ